MSHVKQRGVGQVLFPRGGVRSVKAYLPQPPAPDCLSSVLGKCGLRRIPIVMTGRRDKTCLRRAHQYHSPSVRPGFCWFVDGAD